MLWVAIALILILRGGIAETVDTNGDEQSRCAHLLTIARNDCQSTESFSLRSCSFLIGVMTVLVNVVSDLLGVMSDQF